MKIICLAVLLAGGFSAQARVFNYKDATVAAYVRGTGGLSLLDQDAFANEAGAGTALTGASKYNYGAELGFALAIGANTHLKFGAEMIQENPVNGSGADSSGVKRYDITSSVFVFNPNVALEHVWSSSGSIRYYFSLGAGYAMVTASNAYKMTDAGVAALGVGDFKENMSATALSGQASFGLETLFLDNVTLLADAGYRYLPVRQMKYTGDVKNFTGTFAKGDIVTNSDGSKRTLDLGGLFLGVTFRFYLNFM